MTFPDSDTPACHAQIIARTQAWLTKAVIGLNLCPFAKAVQVKEQIRYVACEARTPEELAHTLQEELRLLETSDPTQIDTTLLIHPWALRDFLDYNDFLDVADAIRDDLGLDGIIQIASFHPDYQFAGTQAEDIDNYTNRSPYPILHLLRESSVKRAVAAFPEASEIFEKNIATMRALGKQGWDALEVGADADRCGTAAKGKSQD